MNTSCDLHLNDFSVTLFFFLKANVYDCLVAPDLDLAVHSKRTLYSSAQQTYVAI